MNWVPDKEGRALVSTERKAQQVVDGVPPH